MANHKSAEKKEKQDEKRRIRNKGIKTRFKNIAKKVEEALSAENRESAQESLQEAISVIDRVASKGVIHKNTASRKKSRLTKRVNALLANK